MKTKGSILLGLIVLVGLAQLAGAAEARLLRFPDVHGQQIIFVYAGDLWTVATTGGVARRLTSDEGVERYPKFSSDGNWIAFSGEYDGNADVFKMPAVGGEPVRLTFHPAADKVVEWTPNGMEVLFLSGRESYSYRFNRLFTVPADGATPKPLVLPTAGLAAYSPDGKKIAYNRMEREHRTWKRYKGGMAQDIWLYDFPNNTIEQITTFEGTDNFPMWHRDKIYFVSDRDHTANIFCYDLNSKQTRKITNHTEYDVKWPSLGTDKIVYENGGYIYLLDLTSETSEKVSIQLYDDKVLTRATFKKVGDDIEWFEIAPDGKRALFGARGDVFTVPAKKGETRNVTQTPGAHERYSVWSPDGKSILYLSDQSGEYEFYLAPQDGKGDIRQLTQNGNTFRYEPVWSPDSKKFLFSDLKQKLYYFDIEKKKQVEIDHDPNDRIRHYRWASDNNWVVYVKTSDNYFGNIFVYSLKDQKNYQLTGNETNDWGPVFDPDGKYLYFLSTRTFKPTFSDIEFSFIYKNTTNICVATLRKDLPSPFAPESDEVDLEKKDEKDKDEEKDDEEEKDKSGKDEEDEEKDQPKEPIKIDVAGFDARVVALPIKSGNYWNLYATKDKLFYNSGPAISQVGPDQEVKPAFHVYDLEKREDKEVIQDCNNFVVSADGKKMIYHSAKAYFIADAGKKAEDGKVETGKMECRLDPKQEWAQIFEEAWRLERDFFYDPNLHQVDWEQMKARYQQLIPYVAHRSDLNYIIGELIGELNCGHTYVGGGDVPRAKRVSTGLLGCDFSQEGEFYKISKIYPGENWQERARSPLTQPAIEVRPGMYLLAVNGNKVRAPENIYQHFQNLADKVVEITVNDQPTDKDAKSFTVKLIDSDQYLRYLDWVNTNREKVAKATNGQVGYLHVPDTGTNGHNHFVKSFIAQVDKKGLVVDVRYNSGGMVPDRMIEYMRRPLINMWWNRYSGEDRWPTVAIHGHFVGIANAWAGSGGDLFPWYFKHYKIGKLIGKRTWGGLVGIGGYPGLIDGGRVSTPNFAFYNLESEWEVEGYGVDPDIEVDNRPDLVVQGRDPQLEKAIEVIQQEIEAEPKVTPKPPVFPDKK